MLRALLITVAHHQTALLAAGHASCRHSRQQLCTMLLQRPLMMMPRRSMAIRAVNHPVTPKTPGFAEELIIAPRITGITLQPMLLAVPRAKKHSDSSSDGQQPRDTEKPLKLSARIKELTSLDELLTLVEENSSSLSPDAVSSSLLRAAYLKREEGGSLSKTTRDRLSKVVSQHLERHMTESISEYDAFTLALCAQKLASMRMSRKSTFRAIEKEAMAKLRDFDSRGLSSLLWAFAKAKFRAPQLFKAVDDHLHNHPGVILKEFNVQDVSTLLWAYAEAGQHAAKLFKAVDAHLNENQELLMDFNPQDFFNLLWAYATTGVQAPQLFAAVESHIIGSPKISRSFVPQGFSNILWAYATAGVQAPKLFEAVESRIMGNPKMLGNFTPQGLSNLLWAYTTAGEEAPKLFEAVKTHLDSHPELIVMFTRQNFSNLLWAYATAGEEAPGLFQSLERRIAGYPNMLGRFNPQEISNLLWVYTSAGPTQQG